VTTDAAVRIDAVVKMYGRQRALGGVSLSLGRGRLCGLLGPNGAGKSTLINVVATLIRPTSGRVHMSFVPGGDARARRAAIGVLAHEPFVYGDLDALENLIFFARLYDVPDPARRASAMLDEVGLEPSAWRRPVRTYSRGMLQRVALARALLGSPELLLLDEPFTGLDRSGARALAGALARAKEQEKILLCATHDLEAIADLCDHVVILRNGRVIHDETRAAPFSLAELKDKVQALMG